MNNNYRFSSPARRRGSQFSLFNKPPSIDQKKDEFPNINKNSSNRTSENVLCSITKMPVIDRNSNINNYKDYLCDLKVHSFKILELTDHYLKNPIDISNVELCEAFYQYSIKCITHLEKVYPKEIMIMKDNILYENSSDDNFLFDPFTIIEKTSGLHLSAFVSKKI
jgi:hypothetical protein